MMNHFKGDDNDDFFGSSPVSAANRKRKAANIIETDSEDEEDGIESDNESCSEDDIKNEEEDENVCPICLSEFEEQPVGIPENCAHLFCNDCLHEWTKNVNNCPVDRKKFNSISVYAKKDGVFLEEIYIEDKVVDDGIEEQPPTFCQICNSCDREDSLLLCDECDNGYHLDCLSPRLHSVPIDEWFCVDCRPMEKEVLSSCETTNNYNREGCSTQMIGQESSLEFIYSRNEADHAVMLASSRMFGGLPSRARTVASSRGRSSIVRNRLSRKSPSSSVKKQRKTKRRKSSKKAKSKKRVEKAERNVIAKELKKFRQRHSTGQTEEDQTSSSFSIFGNQFALNDFDFSDQDEFNDKTKAMKSRSCIIANTTDVVGCIMDGFGTLNPDEVSVSADGTLQPKKRESETERKQATKTEELNKINKQRRRVMFIGCDDSDSDDNLQKNNPVNLRNEAGTKNAIPQKPSSSSREHDVHKEKLLKERLKEKYLEKQAEKLKTQQVDSEIKKMRDAKPSGSYKTTASLHSISKFKIPKKTKPVKEDKEKLISCSVTEIENPPDLQKSSSRKLNSNSNIKNTNTSNIQRSSVTNNDPSLIKQHQEKRNTNPFKKTGLSLEKKYELYSEGKYPNRSRCKSDSTPKSNQSKPIHSVHGNQQSRKQTSQTHARGSSLDSNNSGNIAQRKALVTFSKTRVGNHSSVVSESPKKSILKSNHRKTLSLEDYKQKRSYEKDVTKLEEADVQQHYDEKQLFEDLFGDAELESNLACDKVKGDNPGANNDAVDIQLDPMSADVNICLSPNNPFLSPNNPFKPPVNNQAISKQDKISTTPDHHFENTLGSPFDHFLDALHVSEKTASSAKQQPLNSHCSDRKPFETPANLPIAVVPPSPRTLKTSVNSDKGVKMSQKADIKKGQVVLAANGLPNKSKAHLNNRKNTEERKKTPEINPLIDQMKEILKPYFKSQFLSKEQWKVILKRAVEKVKRNPNYYIEIPDRLTKLLQGYISQLPNELNRPDWNS